MASETTSLLPESEVDNNIVDWDGDEDPENPLNWKVGRKWAHVTIVSLLTFVVPLGATMFAPATQDVVHEFKSEDGVLASLVLSIYVLGWAVGPLIFAPISESHGRLPVYIGSGALYVAFTAACALSPSLEILVLFRFLAGAVGSTPLAIGGATISDLLQVQQRGLALSLYMFGPILGPSVGPLIGGLLTDSLGWRWIFWILAFVYALLNVLIIGLMSETYAGCILRKRAKELRLSTGNTKLRSNFDPRPGEGRSLAYDFIKPIRLTYLSPVNLILSLTSSFVNGLLFLLLATLPIIFEAEYGFTARDLGVAFLPFGIGNIIGLSTFSFTSDKYIKFRQRRGKYTPEDRLVPALSVGPLLAAGFFWYGWSAEYHAPWIVPAIGTALISIGNVLFFSSIIAYLIDTFTVYAASVVGANMVIRSIGGALVPIVGGPMYGSLHWGWGSSILGFLSLGLVTLAVTWLYVDGEGLRRRHPVKL